MLNFVVTMWHAQKILMLDNNTLPLTAVTSYFTRAFCTFGIFSSDSEYKNNKITMLVV